MLRAGRLRARRGRRRRARDAGSGRRLRGAADRARRVPRGGDRRRRHHQGRLPALDRPRRRGQGQHPALRGARRAARRDAQRLASAGGRGLDAERAPGRPVGQDREAEGLPRDRASRAPCSTWPGCGRPRRSSPSTPIRRRRSSAWRTTARWPTCSTWPRSSSSTSRETAVRRREDSRGLLGLRHPGPGPVVRPGPRVGRGLRLRRGAADREVPPRPRGLPAASARAARRFVAGTRTLFSHASIARRDPYVGWAHRGIFYGFITLFAGTVILGFDTDFTEPVFGWSYFHGDFYLAYKEVLNVLGTRADRRAAGDDGPSRDRAPAQARLRAPRPRARRAAVRSPRLPARRLGVRRDPAGDRVDRLPARGRADRDGPPGLRRHAVRRLGGGAGTARWAGHATPTLGGLRHGIWWFHGLLAIAFVASIPYTKAAHMLSSFATLVLRDPLAGKRLRTDRAGARERARRLRDARRLQPAAPAAARRLHEVRQVPRGLPGERHRATALAARRDPRAARAGQRRDGRRHRRRDRRPAGRPPRRTATGFTRR